MWLPWDMHMEAHLLDGVGDVGAGEDEVLKGPEETPIAGRIGQRRVAVRETLPLVSIRVVQGLQSATPARSRMSTMYWHWWRNRPWGRRSTVTPRKWCTAHPGPSWRIPAGER
jgi:hypothetical protein